MKRKWAGHERPIQTPILKKDPRKFNTGGGGHKNVFGGREKPLKNWSKLVEDIEIY